MMGDICLEFMVAVSLVLAVFVAAAWVLVALRHSSARWICTYLDYHPDQWIEEQHAWNGPLVYGTCRRCGERVVRHGNTAQDSDAWARVKRIDRHE
jgi:hypothetical protein